MLKPDRSTYTALDFLGWKAASTLEISPKFQRRGVWTRPAQSYFIETLILGMPVPPIYLRMAQSKDKTKIIREVIDGQQRITAALDFMDGLFPLSKNIESGFGGKKFSQLEQDEQDAISQYGFICEVFQGLGDADILKIFQRLNTYSVKLNAQELRNGQYFGPFKRTAYRVAYENIEFWRLNRIFSERDIARMREVELVSELMIVLLKGMQDKKSSISSFYEKYDDTFPDRALVKKRFDQVIDTINLVMPEGVSDFEFRRSPLFYSLFAVVAHRLFGIEGFTAKTNKKPFTQGDRTSLRDTILKLSNYVAAGRDGGDAYPKKYETFVTACLRQTDNLKPRQLRVQTMYGDAFG